MRIEAKKFSIFVFASILKSTYDLFFGEKDVQLGLDVGSLGNDFVYERRD